MAYNRMSEDLTAQCRRPLKILYVLASIRQLSGGPAYNFSEYIASISERGHLVSLASIDPPADDLEWFKLVPRQIEYRHFQTLGGREREFSPRFLYWLGSNARNYDVVHIAGLLNPFTSLAARIALHFSVPVVATPNGTMDLRAFQHKSRFTKLLWLHFVDKQILRSASIHVESEEEAERLRQVAFHDLDNVHIIPPAISRADISGFASSANPYVLSLSRFHPIKNIELLIDSWPLVNARHPHARLIIAGDGPEAYRASLHKRAIATGCRDGAISFPGWLDGEAKRDAFRDAAAFAVTSHHESFGRAMIEALSAGTPCVVSSRANLAQKLTELGLARTFNPTAENLSTCLNEVLSHESFKSHVRTIGPEFVRHQFDPAKAAASLERLYLQSMNAF